MSFGYVCDAVLERTMCSSWPQWVSARWSSLAKVLKNRSFDFMYPPPFPFDAVLAARDGVNRLRNTDSQSSAVRRGGSSSYRTKARDRMGSNRAHANAGGE